jgi:hypothetical protein
MNNKETLQSYNNKLIQNNNNLQTVIDMINNLPEAGEGGGGIKQTQYINSMQAGTLIGTPPNYLNTKNKNRGTYLGFDIKITPGEVYTIVGQTAYEYRVLQVDEATATAMKNGETVPDTMFIADTGYMGTHEFGVLAAENAAYLWCMCRNPENYEATVELDKAVPIRIIGGEGNGEDLTEELTDYNTKLTTQEDQLLVIAETLKNKAAGANINIFVQEDEPEKKEGLWIKTSQTKPNNISINKLGLKLEWAWEKWTTPVNNAYNRVVKYENYLYSFCGRDSNNNLTNSTFKFNLNTNTAESITPYPINTSASAIGIVNDKIYLFGGATKIATSYVYDIKTDTYTPIKDLPVGTQQAGFVTIGTDVYIFGGASTTSGNSTEVYKYDTLTDTYTKMAGMPVGYCTHCCIYKDGFVYIFGGLKSGGYNQTSFKYNVANNTYTTIKSFPVNRGHYAAGIIGDDIYVFGGYYGGGTYIYDVYKYNTTTDTYTKMPNMSNTWFNGGYVSDGNIVYLVNGEHLGESNDLNVISKYGYINKKEFVNDTIVISTDEDLYNANILNNVNTYFNDVLLYSVAENVYQTNLPVYYGDGEKWISLRGEE